MLKQYIRESGTKLIDLSKDAGIPYSTLNDIVNGKTALDSVSYGTVKKIASALKLSLDTLEELCRAQKGTDIGYRIHVKNKKYYVKTPTGDDICLFKVNKTNTRYVTFAAECLMQNAENTKEQEEVDRKWASYITSCEKTNT